LRRRNNYDSINLKKSVERFFEDFQDVTRNGIEKPVAKYVNHVWENLTLDDYVSLLKKEPNSSIEIHDIYKEYRKKIKAKTEKDFWNTLIETEKEKLLYFILAYPQKVVLVKTGEKDAEKRFLGYEFSNRRGNEGIHPIQRGKTIDECTKLFDENSFDNEEKASTYIYKAFAGDYDFPIHESLKNNISRVRLVDMLTFDRDSFAKNISTVVKKNVRFHEIWGTDKLVSLNDISVIQKGASITKEKTHEGNIPVVAGGKEPAYFHDVANRNGNTVTISASGAYSGFVNYFEMPIFASDCNTIQSKNENEISTKLIYLFLKSIQEEIYGLQRGQAQPHVYADDLAKIQIPLPPLSEQQKIVSEIEVLETKEAEAKEKVEKLKKTILDTFRNEFSKSYKKNIGSCFKLSSGKMLSAKNRNDGNFPVYGGNGITGFHNEVLIKQETIVIGRVGEYCGSVHITEKNSWITDNALYIVNFLEQFNLKYLYYILIECNLNFYANKTAQPNISQTILNPILIPVPPLSEQQKIVAEIEKIEEQIAEAQKIIDSMPVLKNEVLKKYL
jgi:type I restriction enzyme M protein